MSTTLALVLSVFLVVYLSGGLLFTLLLWIRGFDRVDRAAMGSSRWTRLLLSPGTVLLWPALLRPFVQGTGVRRQEANAHRRAETIQ